MLKLEKKQVKIISLAIALFFVLGIVGIALSQSGKSYAAGTSNSSNVGVVNMQMLMSQSPDMAKAQQDFQAEVEQAKKDFEEKTAGKSDKEKQDYYTQVQQRLGLKQQELMEPVMKKVEGVIKEVADAKGLAVILDKGNVVYGGQDITDEVGKKLSGK
ncbi:MAG: OmpH family outer membrane protein [Pelosinus sp.]|nr:OmpH family outer membrane protein [Pelosinus sp.]